VSRQKIESALFTVSIEKAALLEDLLEIFYDE